MAKHYYYLLLSGMLFLSSCQSVEQLSIDYMLPAEVSFPPTLKRVAIVNNMPEVPDNKLIVSEEAEKKEENEIARLTNYYNGDARLTTEALAEALANENYFEEVVICDSALRSKDITPRESTLSREEASKLIQDLDVDFLIALENIQMRSTRKISYLRDWGAFYGTVDVKVYPTVKIYLPNRKGPMVTINNNDSIFWEEMGNGEASVRARLIGENDLIKQASEFAGTVPVKRLLPHWKTANRYLFQGGSVNMRDAAVYAKEGNWAEAVQLWKKNFEAKKGKQKMYSAYNIAMGYEMQDSIDTATEWALKAQQIAREISKVDKKEKDEISDSTISYYILISLYVDELQERKEGLTRLKAQMNRFNE
ncbi:DUF6340 family protein [Bacteroides fluxus]|uniref:Uncharacterized protein n=1 Tax=Bacteroides fluxus YIT 12057 TaxID=763034 RepID=F3PSA5_9BACE|nr:DUF6340 family protein [Bacteroides fluxus]EGF57559.1 hypothetical protein HMPREF9446_01639 [Bacteroides fluxus YIT 12057]